MNDKCMYCLYYYYDGKESCGRCQLKDLRMESNMFCPSFKKRDIYYGD